MSKRFLYLELESCADCPYLSKSTSEHFPYDRHCRKDWRIIPMSSTSPNMSDLRPPIPENCPLPKLQEDDFVIGPADFRVQEIGTHTTGLGPGPGAHD